MAFIGTALSLLLPLAKGLFGSRVAGFVADIAAPFVKHLSDAKALETKERITQYQAQRDVLVAEQGWWLTAMIRPLIAYPFIIYIWKLVIWDKVLGWGVTDPLEGWIGWVATTVVTAYFVVRPFEKIGQKWLAR